MVDFEALRRAVDGEVVLPGSPGYESARMPAIPRFQYAKPLAVVRCRTPADVAEVLAATRGQVPVAVRCGGHCFAGHSTTDGVIMDVSPMASVTVSGDTAVIGAGARLGQVYDELAAAGVTIPAGCGPDVGISGLTLGGGLGVLGRTYGLTSDRLVSAQVVQADGSVVDCDDDTYADLFWALRGAGAGNFGVVTSFTFHTVPPPPMTAFHLRWPASAAVDVVGAWQEWSPDAPDGLAASLLVTADADVSVPPTVDVFGAMVGREADTVALLDELTGAVGRSASHTVVRPGTHRETKRYLSELFDAPGEESRSDGHAYSKSEYFRQSLPADTVQSLVAHLADHRVQGQARELDFSPWNGAYNRVAADATAFVHRAERFLLKQTTVVDATAAPSARDAASDWLTTSWATTHPYGSGGVYPNFPDPDLVDWGHAYYGTNYARLLEVKRAYDPTGVFDHAQALPG